MSSKQAENYRGFIETVWRYINTRLFRLQPKRDVMPIIFTCGSPSKRTEFMYDGDINRGVTIKFASGNTEISHTLLNAVIDHFRGREVRGGFSMTNPTPGGFGQWIMNKSKSLNEIPLSPRHGSFLAAILRDLGYLDCHLDGNAVILKFRA